MARHHSLSVLLLISSLVSFTAAQGCSRISVLGISPFCGGGANPYITEWGEIDVAKAEPWLDMVNAFCDDESIPNGDKVVTVEGCFSEGDTPTVGVRLFRQNDPSINATFVVHGDPEEVCSSHLCNEGDYYDTWGETLEANFDFDCSTSGGPVSETCSADKVVPVTDAPTATPPEIDSIDEVGQAPNAEVFTNPNSTIFESSNTGATSGADSRAMSFGLGVLAAVLVLVA